MLTEIFNFMLWVIADYKDRNPVTNIALQGCGGVVMTPSMSQVYFSYSCCGGGRPPQLVVYQCVWYFFVISLIWPRCFSLLRSTVYPGCVVLSGSGGLGRHVAWVTAGVYIYDGIG